MTNMGFFLPLVEKKQHRNGKDAWQSHSLDINFQNLINLASLSESFHFFALHEMSVKLKELRHGLHSLKNLV